MINSDIPGDKESQLLANGRRRGSWIAFPFIIATAAGMTLSGGGWTSNLIVYLIHEFDVKSIDAIQIFNVITGCSSLIPVLGAILADSFVGCFSVVWISSFISLVGTILLLLTSMLDGLKPQPCKDIMSSSTSCAKPSALKFAVLYLGIALASIGSGGMRTTLSTMGANQFHRPKDQEMFFNWLLFTTYTCAVVASTAIVYIEDNVSWGLGFGVSAAANALGLAIFMMGTRFYVHFKPEGSPFTGLVRVIVATIRKKEKKVQLSSNPDDFYSGHDPVSGFLATAPTKSFRLFNLAALKSEGDVKSNGSIAKPWNLCTVQQVEDFKTLIRVLPIWSSSILLGTPIGIQSSLVILQALAMDRHVGHKFQVPAASILVFVFISTSLCLAAFDRIIIPTWQKLTGSPLTPLKRIAIGHVLNAASMAVSALVESKRLKLAAESHKPMLALWLLPQLAIVGLGEAFHFPGQVTLYYQDFPKSLKNLATALTAVLIGLSFYLSAAIVDLVRRVTVWLPNDMNQGRADNLYWALTIVGVVNFGYYLLCARFYKCKSVEKVMDDNGSGN